MCVCFFLVVDSHFHYTIVNVDGDRHSQVRWRLVFGAMIHQYMGVAPSILSRWYIYNSRGFFVGTNGTISRVNKN